MTTVSKLKLEECSIDGGEFVSHIAVTVRNPGPAALGPGGVRCKFGDGNGHTARVSAPHLWPLGLGEAVTVTGTVPNAKRRTGPQGIAGFSYVDLTGDIHPIDASVSVSLLRGTRIENQG